MSKAGRDYQVDVPAIIPSTFGSLVRHGYEMAVHCWRCQRWADIDAAGFPPEMSYIGRRFRCSCGEGCCPTISKPTWKGSTHG